jgi:hypothetical protein
MIRKKGESIMRTGIRGSRGWVCILALVCLTALLACQDTTTPKTGEKKAPASEQKGQAAREAAAIKVPTMNQADADAFLAKLAPGADYYTCPMHPEVVSDRVTDSCSKCGMKLEKKQKAAASAKPVDKPAEGAAAKLPTTTQADADVFLAKLAPGADYYTCPMHPEVVTDKATDSCPKCGMKLDKKQKAATPAKPADKPAEGAAAKLPTTTQADADAFLAKLALGADYYTCPMHPEVVTDKATDSCPKCGMKLDKKQKAATPGAAQAPGVPGIAGIQTASTDRWAEGYACAMHPDELSDQPGICRTCGCGMKMNKIRVERVLAVPESAVIDTGTRQVVYVESSPGIYDARAVTLGPRAGAWYPVLQGLKLGDRIVSRGSFLIDAEARLNPASSGTGAGG